VIGGSVTVEAVPLDGHAPVRALLHAGDHVGALSVIRGRALAANLRAETKARVALLDQESYLAIEKEFPVVAIPACAAIAEELSWKDELLREIATIDAANVAGDERRAALEARRARVAKRLAGRGGRIVRRAVAWREVVRSWLREPAFFMLVGFVAAFGGARMVVGYIYRNQLEQKLFALHHIEGFENPIHVHHFNYGLILVTITSLLAFFPTFRKNIRTLAFIFGFGGGLIFDEFSLIWRFNPTYYEPLSRYAALTVAVLLAQLAFLRAPWERLLARLLRRDVADRLGDDAGGAP
jgi:hypothetical protein